MGAHSVQLSKKGCGSHCHFEPGTNLTFRPGTSSAFPGSDTGSYPEAEWNARQGSRHHSDLPHEFYTCRNYS